MKEMISNTATGITLLLVIALPFFTLWESQEASPNKKKKTAKPATSIVEVPLVIDSHAPQQLEYLENMNRELNGLLTVFAVPSLRGK